MRKAVIFILILVFGLCFAACAPETEGETPTKEEIYVERCEEVADAVLAQFYDRENNCVYEDTAKNHTAYAWTLMELLSLTNRLEAAGADAQYQAVREELLGILTRYKHTGMSNGEMSVYRSQDNRDDPGQTAGIFFDDNTWIAIEFLNLYKSTSEAKWLEECERVVAFVLTGLNEELGGISWQFDRVGTAEDTINVCTNAPMSFLLTRLYNETEKEEYLTLARRLYNTMYNRLRDREDNLYYDSIAIVQTGGGYEYGNISNIKWPYNSGMMITAGVELYRATGTERYLNEAIATAESADKTFANTAKVPGEYSYLDFPWFTKLLLEGFIELYRYDAENCGEYIAHFESSVNYGYENNRNADGLIAPDWVGGWNAESETTKTLLDHASTAEVYGMLAQFFAQPQQANEIEE